MDSLWDKSQRGFTLTVHVHSTLTVHGKFISVGLPNEPLEGFSPSMFLSNGCFFGGSKIGSKKEAMEMLELAAQKGIKPW